MGEVARLVSGDAVLRSVSIRLELAERLPAVQGDRVQLQQVVLNLILNGLDAMRESVTGDRALVLRTARDGPAAVRVAVRDSGTGIDEADLEHIFQAFYTTKTDGMGMGLAIARSIVEAHGGQLEARNNPEGGATFSFTLPVRTRSDERPGFGPLVCIVDDDPSVRKSLARLVRVAGYRRRGHSSRRASSWRAPSTMAPAASCWTCGCPD